MLHREPVAHRQNSRVRPVFVAGPSVAFGCRATANPSMSVAIAQRGAVRMKRMIDDLLVFTHTRLGDALPVDFTSRDIGRICNDAADEVRASYPDARIDVRVTGETAGK